jgi:hypothetical protein
LLQRKNCPIPIDQFGTVVLYEIPSLKERSFFNPNYFVDEKPIFRSTQNVTRENILESPEHTASSQAGPQTLTASRPARKPAKPSGDSLDRRLTGSTPRPQPFSSLPFHPSAPAPRDIAHRPFSAETTNQKHPFHPRGTASVPRTRIFFST